MTSVAPTVSRKSRERALVEAFLRLSACGAVVERTCEVPDFVLRTDAGPVGLEVTELHIEDDGGKIKPAQRQSIVRDIAARAEKLYRRSATVPTDVAIQFSHGSALLGLNRASVSRALAEFVHRNLPPVGTWHEVRIPHKHPLRYAVQSVRIWAGDPLTKSHWHAPLAGWVSPLSQEIVQRAVDQKATKVFAYRTRTPVVWLLIAIPGDGPSQFFEPDPRFDPARIASPFDRTFLLSQFPSKVVELG